MLVTDTFLIADLADATIYVTRSKYTEKHLLSLLIIILIRRKLKMLVLY